MTIQQKIQKILELPHGEEVWAGIQTLRDADPDRESSDGVLIQDHPLHLEIIQALKILTS